MQEKGSKTSPASQHSASLSKVPVPEPWPLPHQPAEGQTKVGCRHVDALNRQFRYRACARSAGGRTDQTHIGEKLRCFSSRLIECFARLMANI